MNIISDPAFGIRLELEEMSEWDVLHAILRDALTPGFDLASGVSGQMERDANWVDWEEFVVPDLRESFAGHLRTVNSAIEAARSQRSATGAGIVEIPPEHFFDWYAACNQARLALESVHHFGPGDLLDPATLRPIARRAWHRVQLYGQFQNFLLSLGLG